MVLEYTAVEPSPNQGWTRSNLEASEREVTLLGRNDRMSTRNPHGKLRPWDRGCMTLRKPLNSLSLYFFIQYPLDRIGEGNKYTYSRD